MIKITPTNIRTKNTAPSFYIEKMDGETYKQTDARAREHSGLGKFEEWIFFH